MPNNKNLIVTMQNKNYESVTYISIIFIWLFSSYLYYHNYTIDNDFDIYYSFSVSLAMPILILFISTFFCCVFIVM
jgi:hypothetical protein